MVPAHAEKSSADYGHNIRLTVRIDLFQSSYCRHGNRPCQGESDTKLPASTHLRCLLVALHYFWGSAPPLPAKLSETSPSCSRLRLSSRREGPGTRLRVFVAASVRLRMQLGMSLLKTACIDTELYHTNLYALSWHMNCTKSFAQKL
jgi:hypothetical protein